MIPRYRGVRKEEDTLSLSVWSAGRTGHWFLDTKPWSQKLALLCILTTLFGILCMQEETISLFSVKYALSLIYQKGSLVSAFPFWDGIYVLNGEAKSLDQAKNEIVPFYWYIFMTFLALIFT